MMTGQCELTSKGWKAGLSMWECIFSCVRFVAVLLYAYEFQYVIYSITSTLKDKTILIESCVLVIIVLVHQLIYIHNIIIIEYCI